MKKILCTLLTLALLLALALPAAAETENMDAALSAVTLKVKETLDVSDEYTSFSGNYDDYLAGRWYLYWSSAGRELNATADADGKVLECYTYVYSDKNNFFYGFDAAFPTAGRTEAEATAQAWLGRLLGADESAVVDESVVTLGADSDGWRFGGTVYLNGVPSPIRFNLRLGADGELLSYSRSDSYGGYVGAVPSAKATVAEGDAVSALAGAAKLELYWVSDGEGGAELRYVPAWPRTVVDAQSGETIDMDALYDSFGGSGYAAETPAEAMASDSGGRAAGLTEVELGSIENYTDAMSEDELDAALRAFEALGLDAGFAVKSCSYTLDAESGDVQCSLRYTKTMTEDELYGFSAQAFEDARSWGDELSINKYFTMDAKTGALLNLWTSYPLYESDGSAAPADETLAQTAETFLAQAAPEEFAKSARCTLSGYGDSLVWAQRQDGYFYPENALTVTVNAGAGCIDSYTRAWDGDVAFGGTKVVSAAAALDAYIAALEPALGYTAWPESVDYDDPVYRAYADWGYTWVESLRLAWYYGNTDEITGVDAVSGEALSGETDGDVDFVYGDLRRCAEREAVEALAEAGIGFAGGLFLPEESLTQRDAAILLLQANGNSGAETWTDEALGSEMDRAGFIPAASWEPDAVLTRLDFVKTMLGASRYGDAAALTGIWSVGFDDAEELAAAELGWAALAEALGVVSGASLDADGVCTRAAAAAMLSGFMSR